MHAASGILLVEDNFHDIELMVESLRDAGLDRNLVVVRDGVEALDYLCRRGKHRNRTTEPSMVVLDVELPTLSGLDVLREIRAERSLAHLPVVIFSNSHDMNHLKVAKELRANAYIVKPTQFRDFQHAVRTLAMFWSGEPVQAALSSAHLIDMEKEARSDDTGTVNKYLDFADQMMRPAKKA